MHQYPQKSNPMALANNKHKHSVFNVPYNNVVAKMKTTLHYIQKHVQYTTNIICLDHDFSTSLLT